MSHWCWDSTHRRAKLTQNALIPRVTLAHWQNASLRGTGSRLNSYYPKESTFSHFPTVRFNTVIIFSLSHSSTYVCLYIHVIYTTYIIYWNNLHINQKLNILWGDSKIQLFTVNPWKNDILLKWTNRILLSWISECIHPVTHKDFSAHILLRKLLCLQLNGSL